MYGNIKDGADAEAEIERVCHRRKTVLIYFCFRSVRLWRVSGCFLVWQLKEWFGNLARQISLHLAEMKSHTI